jgi:hypothetical protein
VNAAGSGFFRIDARDASGSPYPTPPLVCSGPGDPCLLNPVNDFDLGRDQQRFGHRSCRHVYHRNLHD